MTDVRVPPGPQACPFPGPDAARWRDRWTCPGCGTRYVATHGGWWRRSLLEFPWHRMALPLIAVACSAAAICLVLS